MMSNVKKGPGQKALSAKVEITGLSRFAGKPPNGTGGRTPTEQGAARDRRSRTIASASKKVRSRCGRGGTTTLSATGLFIFSCVLPAARLRLM